VHVSFQIANVECLKTFLLCDRGALLHLVDTKVAHFDGCGEGLPLPAYSYLFLLLRC